MTSVADDYDAMLVGGPLTESYQSEEPMNVDSPRDLTEDRLSADRHRSVFDRLSGPTPQRDSRPAASSDMDEDQPSSVTSSSRRRRSDDRDRERERDHDRGRDRRDRRSAARRSPDRRRSRSRSRGTSRAGSTIDDRSSRRGTRSPPPRRRSRSRSPRIDRYRSRDFEDRYDPRSYRSSGRRGSRRSRSRSPPRRHHRRSPPPRADSRDRAYRSAGSRRAASRSPARSPAPQMTQAERDQRTVFVAQLHAQARPSDIRKFFEDHDVGRVRDVKLIADRGRRMKGLGYIEFYELESVPKAVELTGQLLMGIPVIVERTEAEKNRLAEEAAAAKRLAATSLPPRPSPHPMGRKDALISHTIFAGNLPGHLGAADIQQIFEPFGQIDSVRTQPDQHFPGRGAAYVTYQRTEDAANAVKAMAGFTIDTVQIKCIQVYDQDNVAKTAELDDVEGVGVKLNALSRVELMAKLARTDSVSLVAPGTPGTPGSATATAAPTSTCLLLTNMFDPAEETEPDWDKEIEIDVQQECERSYGPVAHIRAIKDSPGHVYVKFTALEGTNRAREGLHGRWFGSRQVSATAVPEATYRDQFPDAFSA
ncbi:CC1-like family splicing factor [Allomyces macrogynus ATCC 38327]|uniref:CC1-like family splicing factor n=1 Tax=Allomyces macrogynus (strain ATCC 38327) TaxID=578462 RepID=A0A0L0RW04_ALLM3|nr:CC1-like family splicing factor [Allomyces macrogynus ATCC 38327]|eukprot:KNE54577.1 CC1-like family splicing factor [Allomyces macrogynus ATCC 38327]